MTDDEDICKYCGSCIVELPEIDGCFDWFHKWNKDAKSCGRKPEPDESGVAVVTNERSL